MPNFLKVNIQVSDSVKKLCIDYINNKPSDRNYDSDNLSEYYIDNSNFKSNFKFKHICIGKLNTGQLSIHTDDDRNSALIIPLSTIKMKFEEGEYYLSEPFLVDTSKPHGAESNFGAIFIALDFDQHFEDSRKYLETLDDLRIDII